MESYVKSSGEGISIICACKNRSDFLEKSLTSWLSHSEIDEIIIIDWDSNPQLENLSEKYKTDKIITVRVPNQPKWVLSKAYNLAARFASKDKILKLDTDIVLLKGFFKNLNIEKNHFYSGNWKIAKRKNEKHLNGTVLLYKQDFFKINGYNEEITTYGWDDCDLYKRLENIGLKKEDLNTNYMYHIPHNDKKRIEFQPEVENCLYEIKKNKDKFEESLNLWEIKKVQEYKLHKISQTYYLVNEENQDSPKVSIITSVFKGDKYIKEFLEDITRQTIFNNCELILINPNSPGNEEKIILEYTKKYPNIIYKKLTKDPGLYEVWNLGAKIAKGKYITNANLDDRRSPRHIEKHIEVLEKESDIDVVTAPLFVTYNINESFEKNTAFALWFKDFPEYFTGKDMFKVIKTERDEKIESKNMIHCMPVWRKDLHLKNGYFDEENYGSSADWEFWLRCSRNGAKFKLLRVPLGLYLLDKNSHNRTHLSKDDKIAKEYYQRNERFVTALISHKHKFIYINNPKAACSSIKQAICNFLKVPQEITDKWKRGEKGRYIQVEYNEINILNKKYDEYFKFTFVRNPWDRIVSAYSNKIDIKNRTDNLSAKKLIEYYKKEDISFEEFVNYLEYEKDEFADPHWRSQSNLVKDTYGNTFVNYLGRFENINEDFNKLCSKLEIPVLKLPHLVKTDREKYNQYYNSITKKIIEERFSEDIKSFGYNFSTQLFESPNKFKLIIPLYNELDKERVEEYITCLKNNLSNNHINEIIIFYDISKDNKENKILDFIKNNNLKIKYIYGRPAYKDLFEYANKSFQKDTKVIIANADIYFNQTLSSLKNLDLNNIFLALTRWDVQKDNQIKFFEQIKEYKFTALCDICKRHSHLESEEEIKEWGDSSFCKDLGCNSKLSDIKLLPGKTANHTCFSQDTWIFQTPLKIDFPCDFKLGTLFCDSFLNNQLLQSKLRIYNPSKDIQTLHLHLSNIRSEDNIKAKKERKKILLEESKKGNRNKGIEITPLSKLLEETKYTIEEIKLDNIEDKINTLFAANKSFPNNQR